MKNLRDEDYGTGTANKAVEPTGDLLCCFDTPGREKRDSDRLLSCPWNRDEEGLKVAIQHLFRRVSCLSLSNNIINNFKKERDESFNFQKKRV